MSAKRSRDLERKSSAVTLSDMEIFIFPEILYSLVLANIMSPTIWRWRDDPWFKDLDGMKPYRRITRMKQFIMDHYSFNLDLDTWGLTTKEKEIARFSDFVNAETLAKSNALFGYEGDKYYFDIDIRTHFGLTKYQDNIIPYWKTETVEAMDAFKFKTGYTAGAGECVSLAALYAAAFFVICKIPLEDIFLMATPLHSQNYVDIDDGILTNNRRLVTRTMWFNGTALSAQARRAIENEQVTVVTHESGCIHVLYDEATIDPARYDHFSARLRKYLSADLSVELLDNFLRHTKEIQPCFQVRWPLNGTDHYVTLTDVFAMEADCPYSISDNTRARLMAEIDHESFRKEPFPECMILNDLEDYLRSAKTDIHNPLDQAQLMAKFACDCCSSQNAIKRLIRFCKAEPRLPVAASKSFVKKGVPLAITPGMGREEIIQRLDSIRTTNDFADLAFYAYRDLTRTPAEPFLLAAVERNPVSIEATSKMEIDDIAKKLDEMPVESIYEETGRLAQPDEVWNYQRGDGIEKALLMANILRNRGLTPGLEISIDDNSATLHAVTSKFVFATRKKLPAQRWPIPA